MLTLAKYSIGVGDRFACQAPAQLRACLLALQQGTEVIPVWNKSHREHLTVGSQPEKVRAAADAAVKELGWSRPYHVDADHIRLETVAGFLPHADFFTIDVADSIGRPVEEGKEIAFARRHPELSGVIEIAGIERRLEMTSEQIENVARKYLRAVEEAGRIYRHIASGKGAGKFITEVSMDETDAPQTPPELLIILAALADEGVPVQTIAPKFTGRFNKGVDYQGDVAQFEKEFAEDLAVVAHAVKQYGLPKNLKLSVHSGSDKFSIYPAIRRSLERSGAGLHVKTAGTTWLEEVIGLAESPAGIGLAKEIYKEAHGHLEELCAPYAAVIDIDPARLPSPSAVEKWSSEEFAGALRHDPANPRFNPDLRQLLHVGYKVAAKMGERYLQALRECKPAISQNVTGNLFDRHLTPLFAGLDSGAAGPHSGGRESRLESAAGIAGR